MWAHLSTFHWSPSPSSVQPRALQSCRWINQWLTNSGTIRTQIGIIICGQSLKHPIQHVSWSPAAVAGGRGKTLTRRYFIICLSSCRFAPKLSGPTARELGVKWSGLGYASARYHLVSIAGVRVTSLAGGQIIKSNIRMPVTTGCVINVWLKDAPLYSYHILWDCRRLWIDLVIIQS